MSVQIQIRRGTAATWTSANPTLAAGEIGLETDTSKIKIGDGATAWASLAYFGSGATGAAGGDLSGTYPNPSVVDDSHAHSATSVTTHSTAHAHSSLTGITATDHHAAPVAGPDANNTIDAAGAAGTAGAFARSGHGHQTVTTAGPGADNAIDAAGAAGATGAVARAGHGHRTVTYTTAAAAIGTASAGTLGTAPPRGDHVHPTGAGTPTTQAFGDAAATGAGPAAAMTDHRHGMPAAPTKLGNIFVPASAMLATVTNGATGPSQIERPTNFENFVVMDFPDAATRYAQFTLDMPTDYDGGTFTCEFEWTNANANTLAVRWQIEARMYADAATLDAAWGTAIAVTDNNQNTAYQFLRSAATAAVTAAGAAAGGLRMLCRIARLGADAADTLTSDARLLGVRLVYTRT